MELLPYLHHIKPTVAFWWMGPGASCSCSGIRHRRAWHPPMVYTPPTKSYQGEYSSNWTISGTLRCWTNLASVPVGPFPLYSIVVICNPGLQKNKKSMCCYLQSNFMKGMRIESLCCKYGTPWGTLRHCLWSLRHTRASSCAPWGGKWSKQIKFACLTICEEEHSENCWVLSNYIWPKGRIGTMENPI